MTKSFVKQALQYLTDDTISDALLRYLLDPIMNNKLKLAHAKLEELMAVHKEHSEIRNHYFTDIYNALQQKQSEVETADVLQKAFENRSHMTDDDISSLVTILREKREAGMDLVAAESTYYAMKAFYKVYRQNSSY